MAIRTDDVCARAIEQSLELAAERAGDLTPRVYALLFARHPDMEFLFWRDRNNMIKGEMLARVFETLLDFVGERHYADHLIQSEVVTHEGYDVPREVFMSFFGILEEAVREACGTSWTKEMNWAWQLLLKDLSQCVQKQSSSPA